MAGKKKIYINNDNDGVSEDNKNKNKKRDNIFSIILGVCDVIAVVVLFLLYGPFNGFRDWLVTTEYNESSVFCYYFL